MDETINNSAIFLLSISLEEIFCHWKSYNEKELIFHHSNFQTLYPYLIYLYYISTCIIIIFHFPLGLSNFQLYLLTCPPYQPVSTHRMTTKRQRREIMTPLRTSSELNRKRKERGGRVALVPRFGVSGGSCPSERTRDAALPLADTRRATRVCVLSFPPHPSCRPSSLRCTPVAR